MGPAVQDEIVRKTVVIRNEGGANLEVGPVDSSRFCSGTLNAHVIEPGKAAELAVTCRSDLYGSLREGIDIHSNDANLPVVTLRLVADVTPLLAFDMPSVQLQMPFGEERTAEVRLVGALLDKAHIRLKSSPPPDVDVVPSSPEPNRVRSYRVHCRGHLVGTNSGNIIIATGLERPKEVAIPVACIVTGTLKLAPTNPYFNLKISGDRAVRITARSSQPNFEIHAVHITDGPFAARFEHAEDDNAYHIDVTVVKDRIDDEARSAAGTLLIVSNDRTEPEKKVPLFASGRVNKVAAPEPAGPSN